MDDQGFNEKSLQIRQMAGMPVNQLSDQLAGVHQHLGRIAPSLTPHVHSLAMNAVNFLNSKLPHVGNELPQDRNAVVSAAQRRAWLDLHGVVSDPLKILDHVEKGTLNNHHIEAVRAVYPDLHQEMVQKVQEQVGSMKLSGKKVPYGRRAAIAKFIGQPLDSTMTPQAAQAIVRSASPPTGPAAQAQQKASGPELSQINKVNAIYTTKTQAKDLKS